MLVRKTYSLLKRQLCARKIIGAASDGSFDFALASCGFCMRYLGLWPSSSLSSSVKFLAYLAALTLVTGLQLCSVCTTTDHLATFKNVVQFFIGLFVTVKAIAHKLKERQLRRVFDAMRHDWETFDELPLSSREMVMRYVNVGRCINLAAILFAMVPCVFFQYNYVINCYDVRRIRENPASNAIHSWSLSSHELRYTLLYLLELYCSLLGTISTVTMETFFYIVMLHAIARMELLNAALRGYGDDDERSSHAAVGPCACVRCIVCAHVELLRFISYVESTFNTLLFLDLVRYFSTLCGIIYYLKMYYHYQSFAGLSEFIAYLVFTAFSALLPCLLSQLVADMLQNFGLLAYTKDWLQYDHENVQCIYLMILCSQKPVKITACKLWPVNIDTFRKIVTTSISYASILFALK